MATKDQAIKNARYMIKRTGKPEFIYRVGVGWMITGQSLEITQAEYKVKIKNYQEVNLNE